MTWRIHFTSADLLRIKVAPTLGPLAETMFGLSLLGCSKSRTRLYTPWTQRARESLGPHMLPLMSLFPRGYWGVDLWSLTGEATEIEQSLEALLEIPREHLLTELHYVDRMQALPSHAWAAADSQGRKDLAQAARASFQAILEPYWPQVRAHLHAERMARGRVLLDGGVEKLLSTLYPERLRWKAPVLEVNVRSERDVHLEGRGLILVPSLFVVDVPALLLNVADPSAPPILVYPASPEPTVLSRLWGASGSGSKVALGALVGRTRAAALEHIAAGCTTGELARALGVSPAAASQHATVLREAGLITTRRHGSSVLHSVTTLGQELLEST